MTAILREHMYIVVREQEKSYPTSGYAFGGREMPFHSRIRINTKVTPDIDAPPQSGGPGFFSQYSFWVTIDHVNFQFHLTAEDLSGAKIDFLAPLIFVSDSETNVGAVYPAASDASTVKANYVAGGLGPISAVRGKKVAYADPSAGDTSLKTSGLYFDAQITSAFPFASAPFTPGADAGADRRSQHRGTAGHLNAGRHPVLPAISAAESRSKRWSLRPGLRAIRPVAAAHQFLGAKSWRIRHPRFHHHRTLGTEGHGGRISG